LKNKENLFFSFSQVALGAWWSSADRRPTDRRPTDRRPDQIRPLRPIFPLNINCLSNSSLNLKIVCVILCQVSPQNVVITLVLPFDPDIFCLFVYLLEILSSRLIEKY
jgi:hypothetical protein